MKKNTKVAVVGLGYVGLPLLLLLHKKFYTYGFDQNIEKIDLLKKNKSYISDVLNKDLKKLKNNKFYSIRDLDKINECEYIIFCLPTPLIKEKPDLSYVTKAFKDVFPFLRKDQTIIFESSVYTGATKEIFFDKLSKKFNVGNNFFLCYSPERIDPGKSPEQSIEYTKITKLVSGYSNKCLTKIYSIYSRVFKKIYKCESIEIAETSKLFENIYRSVNIGLVNELKVICDKLNLNVHKIIDAASSKPFGFRPFHPGPGVGGHCIPIDPLYLSWISRKKKYEPKFIKLSVEINTKITLWTLKKILNVLKGKKKEKVLVIGLSYKKDVNDLRESPSVQIFKSLVNKGFKVDYHDPYINKYLFRKKIFRSVKIEKISKYQCVIILTDHTNVNYKKILSNSKKIIDTRGKFAKKFYKKIIHI